MATPNTPAFITQIVDQDIDYTGDIYDRDITVDPTPQLSGSAPVNSHVYIYDDGKLIGSVQADGEGNWSFTPDRDLGTGSHVLTVMAHGKMSEPVVITVQASGASTGRPVITSVVDNEGEPGEVEHGATISDKPPTLSGTAAPNAYVEIFSSGRSVGFTQANAEGHWTITPTLPEGLNILSVKSQGQHSDIFTLTVEAATSVKPIIESVHDNHGESAMVGDGGSTDDNTPTVSGTARPGAIIQLYANGREVGRAQADSNGNWSITSSALDNGEQVLKVSSDGKFSDGFTINVEASTTPELPELSIQTVYDDQGESGMVGDGGSTDDNTPTVSGTARPGAIVQLYANGREVGRAQADSNGNWSITTSALDNGQQVLKVSSEGTFSDGYVIDVQVPAEGGEPVRPAIEYVYDDFGSDVGQRYSGDSIDDRTPLLAGTAAPPAIVEIYSNGQLIYTLQAGETGHWGFTASLPYGEHTLTAVVGGVSSEPFDLTIVDPSQVPVESEHNNALSLDSLLADSHLDVFGQTTEPVAELDPAQTLQLMEAFMSESANALGGNVADLGCMPLTAELVLPVEELLQPTL